jgi:hypothetical protein
MDNTTNNQSSKQLLRGVAGALAVAALGVTLIRLYAISKTGVWQPDPFFHFMRLIFPLSVALIFGYVAWKGKLPFMENKDQSRDH